MTSNNFKRFDLIERLIENGEIFAERCFCAAEFGVRIGFRERTTGASLTRSLSITMTKEQARKFVETILSELEEPK